MRVRSPTIETAGVGFHAYGTHTRRMPTPARNGERRGVSPTCLELGKRALPIPVHVGLTARRSSLARAQASSGRRPTPALMGGVRRLARPGQRRRRPPAGGRRDELVLLVREPALVVRLERLAPRLHLP